MQEDCRVGRFRIRPVFAMRPVGAPPRAEYHPVRRGFFPIAAGYSSPFQGAEYQGGIIRSQLFGVTIFDPATLATVVIVLLATAAIASLLPSTRAARIEPVRAFRDQ